MEIEIEKELDSDSIHIKKGAFIYSDSPRNTGKNLSKHFVFDLDETIGSFTEMSILWRGILWISNQYKLPEKGSGSGSGSKLFVESQQNMNLLLSLYPEFLRYGIITILQFLYYKKTRNEFGNMYIYTNNQCASSWTTLILGYIEKIGNMKGLFNQIILPFKRGSQIVEKRRTTTSKTYQDLIRCTLLPKTSEFCFIDNTYFAKMATDRVFYIQLKPYYHCLTVDEIIGRFLVSDLGKQIVQESGSNTKKWEFELYDWFIDQGSLRDPIVKSCWERELDIQVSKKLMYHIKEFFYLIIRKQKTQKKRGKYCYNVSKKNRVIH